MLRLETPRLSEDARLALGGAGLLGEPVDIVLLRPAAWDAPRLDEIRQQLCWTLFDEGGARLLLRLPYEPWKAERMANLETWAEAGQPLEAVLARLDRGAGGSLLEPFALAVAREGAVRAVSLDFERGPARPSWPRCAIPCWRWAWTPRAPPPSSPCSTWPGPPPTSIPASCNAEPRRRRRQGCGRSRLLLGRMTSLTATSPAPR